MKSNKLKAKIIERGMNVEELASAIGMDKTTMYRKLRDIEKFTVGDVAKIKEKLELTSDETCAIFID